VLYLPQERECPDDYKEQCNPEGAYLTAILKRKSTSREIAEPTNSSTFEPAKDAKSSYPAATAAKNASAAPAATLAQPKSAKNASTAAAAAAAKPRNAAANNTSAAATAGLHASSSKNGLRRLAADDDAGGGGYGSSGADKAQCSGAFLVSSADRTSICDKCVISC
jgi:hypothetical protein